MADNETLENGGADTAAARDGLTTPIAPEGGRPADPGPGDTPVPPIAPEGGFPVPPGIDLPVPPIAPEGGRPVDPGPVWPDTIYPNQPQAYGQVRFLNASTNSFPVNISIDSNNYAINSRFGTISNYEWVADGFHTVTVRRTSGMRTILYQQTFPFVAGEKLTMVLVDSGSGLDMVRVSDMGCTNMPYNSGCYRMANMSSAGTSYDLMLYGGETVFRNVRFGNVSAYKQAVAGSYQFYVTNSGAFTVIREMPIIVIGAYTTTSQVREPLTSFAVDILAGRNYTTYLIGNNWSDYNFRALTVED